MEIACKKVTSENFASFGRLVRLPEVEPTASGQTFKFWSDIAHYNIDGETEIGLCTVYAQPEISVEQLERHNQTPEILIPVDAAFMLPLLLDGNSPEQAECFQVEPGEAVVIDESVWHGPCIPVGKKECTYFVIFRRGTPHTDVEFRAVSPITISE